MASSERAWDRNSALGTGKATAQVEPSQRQAPFSKHAIESFWARNYPNRETNTRIEVHGSDDELVTREQNK